MILKRIKNLKYFPSNSLESSMGTMKEFQAGSPCPDPTEHHVLCRHLFLNLCRVTGFRDLVSLDKFLRINHSGTIRTLSLMNMKKQC